MMANLKSTSYKQLIFLCAVSKRDPLTAQHESSRLYAKKLFYVKKTVPLVVNNEKNLAIIICKKNR